MKFAMRVAVKYVDDVDDDSVEFDQLRHFIEAPEKE